MNASGTHQTGRNARRANSFGFCHGRYQAETGQAVLTYTVDGMSLHEHVMFPWAPWPADASRQAAFLRALELLHLVAGVSYYKAGLAADIHFEEARVDETLAGFLNDLYRQGLAEFAHVNRLDIASMVRFDAITRDVPPALELDLPERALVAMGGGKDSLVCLEMLRDAGIEVQPACVGASELIGKTVSAAGLPLIRIGRQLSPRLSELNSAGAWNGHVPITAINSLILICAALLYGYRYVVFANESSADEATLIDESGRAVNHQYSKSLSFEKALRNVIRRRVTPGLEYFSLLRPLNEIEIAERFAGMTRYHRVFSSCNRNFHQRGPRIDGRWCGDCPKCRFTALALAPFLDPVRLTAIQGVNMLDDDNQLQGYRALCGLGAEKPFECVGSKGECRAAMKKLSTLAAWRDSSIVRTLADEPGIRHAAPLDAWPDMDAQHCIPAWIQAKIDAFA